MPGTSPDMTSCSRLTIQAGGQQGGVCGFETVIASQRVGAKRRPMINSAKQSIVHRKERMDCFVASLLAMTAVKAAHPGAGEYDAASGAGDPVLAIRF